MVNEDEKCIRIYTLQNEGLLSTSLTNPVTKKLIPGNLCVMSYLSEDGTIKNSFNEVLALKETYNSTIYYYSNDNLGWIRGKIENHEIRIVFIRIPEADENEEVKDNDTIEILRIVDCNLAKSIYNSDVYEGDALL